MILNELLCPGHCRGVFYGHAGLVTDRVVRESVRDQICRNGPRFFVCNLWWAKLVIYEVHPRCALRAVACVKRTVIHSEAFDSLAIYADVFEAHKLGTVRRM